MTNTYSTLIAGFSFRALQEECRKNGLGAGGSATSLRRRLIGKHNADIRALERRKEALQILAKPMKKNSDGEENGEDGEKEHEKVPEENNQDAGEDAKKKREEEDGLGDYGSSDDAKKEHEKVPEENNQDAGEDAKKKREEESEKQPVVSWNY